MCRPLRGTQGSRATPWGCRFGTATEAPDSAGAASLCRATKQALEESRCATPPGIRKKSPVTCPRRRVLSELRDVGVASPRGERFPSSKGASCHSPIQPRRVHLLQPLWPPSPVMTGHGVVVTAPGRQRVIKRPKLPRSCSPLPKLRRCCRCGSPGCGVAWRAGRCRAPSSASTCASPPRTFSRSPPVLRGRRRPAVVRRSGGVAGGASKRAAVRKALAPLGAENTFICPFRRNERSSGRVDSGTFGSLRKGRSNGLG
ncbi:hypothetical protein SAMN04488074_123120 [Lentzea albidocapillata subsp. violacea]|uniref:Uncharacterized protein n=1 Tax=Lentzea albidocapillata subsp. violacea TaxID=128104 RepID=A0A1G9UCM4_9PSEU|nr:hypothetical protein SAMN04488074_123120 [Lentzea albidocapillata subsp. violacea]